jgi:hypothetical protein
MESNAIIFYTLVCVTESVLLAFRFFLVLDDATTKVLADDVKLIPALVKFLSESLSVPDSCVELLLPLQQPVSIE